MKNSFKINNILGFTLCLYVFSIPLFSYREGFNAVTNILALISFIVYIFKVMINKGNIKYTIFFSVYFIFIVWGLFTYLYAINRAIVLTQTITLFLNYLISLALFNYINRSKEIELILISYIIGCFISILYVFLKSDIFCDQRIGSIVANLNRVSFIYSIALVFLFYFVQKYKKYILYIPILILTFFILLTGSRQGVIAVILFFSIYSYIKSKKNFFGLMKTLLLSLTIIIILYHVIMGNEFLYNVIGYRFEIIKSMFEGTGTVGRSTWERAYMISLGLDKFVDRPFLGYGLGNFQELLAHSGFGKATYSHNNVIELLTGVGFIGTILFYLIYFKYFINTVVYVKRKHILSSILFSYNIVVIISGYAMVHYPVKIFILVLILGVSQSEVLRKESEANYKKRIDIPQMGD